MFHGPLLLVVRLQFAMGTASTAHCAATARLLPLVRATLNRSRDVPTTLETELLVANLATLDEGKLCHCR